MSTLENCHCHIDEDGTIYWLKNGLLHREDGPALESHKQKKWYFEGQLHRENNLPAIENLSVVNPEQFFGSEWWVHGKRHRENGPAIEFSGMTKMKLWFINGVELNEEQFHQYLKRKPLNDKLKANLRESSNKSHMKI